MCLVTAFGAVWTNERTVPFFLALTRLTRRYFVRDIASAILWSGSLRVYVSIFFFGYISISICASVHVHFSLMHSFLSYYPLFIAVIAAVTTAAVFLAFVPTGLCRIAYICSQAHWYWLSIWRLFEVDLSDGTTAEIHKYFLSRFASRRYS